MANPCRVIITDADLAKKLGVEVGSGMSFAEFAMKVHEGKLEDMNGNIPPVSTNEKETTNESQPPFEGFRKAVLSDVQNTFKTAKTSFQNMVADGLANLDVKSGETIFKATERKALEWLAKLNNKEKISLNTDETAQMQYYHASLRKQAFDIANNDKLTYAEKQYQLADLDLKLEGAEQIWGAAGQEQARAFAMRQLEASMTPEQRIEVRRMEFYRKSGIDEKELSQKEIDYYDNKVAELQKEYEAKEKELAEKYEAQ